MNHRARLRLLEQWLEAERLDGVLITHMPNVRYLCGFTGSSGVLTFSEGAWLFCTDGRYTEQAKTEVVGSRVLVRAQPPLIHAARQSADRLKRTRRVARIGIEAEHMTLAMQSRINSEFASQLARSRYRLVGTSGLVEQFRIKKDRDEIRQIRKAVQLASDIFPNVLKALRPGMSENELAAELELRARRAGGEKMSFETIVASGRRSALPHARPTRQRIGRGFVVLDYGVILGGYCSYMTRTVCVGRADKAAQRIYASVLEAQLAGIAAVRAGAEAQQVDSAARNVLRKHKLDRYFTHSLGHGVGLEIHEAPRLARGQTQKLETGMVVTIEPGVYIPGRVGVRIEDMVLVTDTGCEILTPTPKELVTR
jgi:Xaa-Pro aminopeptidase